MNGHCVTPSQTLGRGSRGSSRNVGDGPPDSAVHAHAEGAARNSAGDSSCRRGLEAPNDVAAVQSQSRVGGRPNTRLVGWGAAALSVVLAIAVTGIDQPANAHTYDKQTGTEQRYSDAILDGRAAIRALMDHSRIPGMSVAVGIRGQLVWSEGFGYADVQNKVPVTRWTRFRLGSVSKLLTVGAAAKLYERGVLDLDAAIHRYVPTFPHREQTITARQLAGHLGGIRHYQAKDHTNGRNIDAEHYRTVTDSLRIFQDDPLVARPGTQYHYSTFGYTLLSAVIEGASHKDFLQYLHEAVLQPLRMEYTTADRPEVPIPGRTAFYDPEEPNRIRKAPYVDPSYKWAGGGMLSTADDLVRFGSAHVRPGFFKAETLDLLFRTQRTTDGAETGVGIGWHIGTDSEGRRIVHHAGNMGGCRSIVLIYPESQVVVAILSNLGGTPRAIEDNTQAIAKPFLKGL
jgi:serine beta-lactamase-like protein LACTB